MHCNRLHSRWVSGREGMLCAFGVGTWDHEGRFLCLHTETESVGSIGIENATSEGGMQMGTRDTSEATHMGQ